MSFWDHLECLFCGQFLCKASSSQVHAGKSNLSERGPKQKAEAKLTNLGHLCKEFHYKCSVCIIKDIFSQLFMHLCNEDFFHMVGIGEAIASQADIDLALSAASALIHDNKVAANMVHQS